MLLAIVLMIVLAVMVTGFFRYDQPPRRGPELPAGCCGGCQNKADRSTADDSFYTGLLTGWLLD